MNIMLACCYGCVALEAGELDRVECIMVISRALSGHPEIVTYNFLDVEINVTSTIVSFPHWKSHIPITKICNIISIIQPPPFSTKGVIVNFLIFLIWIIIFK